MAGKNDFLVFYEQLGLPPNCSADELKRAYRRRVSELHPDRRIDSAADTVDAAYLQELTAAYNEATIFQRRYGRLPGAQHVTGRATALPQRQVRAAAPMTARRSGVRRLAFGACVLAAFAWLVWGNSTGDDARRTNDLRAHTWAVAPSPTAPAPDAAATQPLQLGMDSDTVRALEGSPLMANDERWDYGPSWIQFEHGKVSDWYSSTLRPLKGATAQPRGRALQP